VRGIGQDMGKCKPVTSCRGQMTRLVGTWDESRQAEDGQASPKWTHVSLLWAKIYENSRNVSLSLNGLI